MRELIAAGALVAGLFSGVDIEHIMDTPALVQDAIIQAVGADLLKYGEGMKVGEQDGQEVVVTEEGFSLEYSGKLSPGLWTVTVEALAPSRSTDSYWVQLDGEQLKRPLLVPLDTVRSASAGFRIEEGGEHTVRLVLREAPGSVIRSWEIARPTIEVSKPPLREELEGVHPRLFITAKDLDTLRARLDDETVQRYYKRASTLTRKPPEFRPGKRNGGAYRRLGDYALDYLLRRDPEQLAGVTAWLETATTYPDCGVDLDAEYFMEGVALSYDWLYDELSEDLRARVRETIARQCRKLYEASLAGHTGGGHSYQQNHFWYAHLALILGAAAVYGEVTEAKDWLAWGWDRAERIFLTFGTDGGFHEGPGYWNYSMPTLYMLVSLYESCTGERIPWADQGLHGQAEFRLRYLYPGLTRTAAMEDTQTRAGRPAVSLLLWEAKRFQDPVVQGIAEALNRGASSYRFNLLWLDEKLQAQDPFAALALARHYPDVETVFARTSWGDDATALVMDCRPLGGHLWAELCDRFYLGGTGHNHPAQGHFVLFGRGEVLAVDPGYTYKKLTRNHNTILIDGEGQYGDGEMWPHPTPGRAHFTGMVSEGDVTIIAADPSSAYPQELGVERFERFVALAGRDLVVVCDRLRTAEPHVFSWLLHHYGEVSERDNTWTVTRGDAQLTLAPVLPEHIEAALETYRPLYIHPTRDYTPRENADINLIELKSEQVSEVTFLVPLLVADAGVAPAAVERLEAEGCDAVRVGDIVVAFRRGEEKMTVQAPWGEAVTSDARALVAGTIGDRRQVIKLP
ncbi:MAG: DUF4962 domain-containing protein [Armatimonadetes bacterium]|nr:DUF4962 domain-containing protein [Armatimonadota bacterium]